MIGLALCIAAISVPAAAVYMTEAVCKRVCRCNCSKGTEE